MIEESMQEPEFFRGDAATFALDFTIKKRSISRKFPSIYSIMKQKVLIWQMASFDLLYQFRPSNRQKKTFVKRIR